jgi:CHAT domain-containing protein
VCCSDYVISSYSPTLSALLRAQNKIPSEAPSRISLLAIAEDCRKVAGMSTLRGVESELTHIEEVFNASKHDSTVEAIRSAATVESVSNRITSANFVHLACHGIQAQGNALESGFYLSDEKLTVSKLMDLDLDQAWLAYLSACETAKGDAQQPDQGIHLAAAMLFAGFKSVVATMWYVPSRLRMLSV